MGDPLQPGELRFSLQPSHPIREKIFVVGVCFAFLVLVFLGIRDIWRDFTSDDSPPPQTAIRIPPAPIPLVSKAIFFVHPAGHENGIEKAAEGNVSLGFVYERLAVTSVAAWEDIPTHIRSTALNVNGTDSLAHATLIRKSGSHYVAQQRSRQLSFIPMTIDTNGVNASRLNPLANEQRPVIIHGDVDIATGPLQRSDVGMAKILIDNGEFRYFYLDFAAVHGPRGPPPVLSFEMEKGYRPTRDVYVIGKVNKYTGPDLHGRSFMKTKIIDLGLMSPHGEREFLDAMRLWHESARLLVPESPDGLPGNLGLGMPTEELEAQAGHEVVRSKSGRFFESGHPLLKEEEEAIEGLSKGKEGLSKGSKFWRDLEIFEKEVHPR